MKILAETRKMLLGIILLCHIAPLTVADRVVMTENGPVRGITVFSDGMDVEAFLGIPYAEPPVSSLRFKRPVPKGPWSGVFDASQQPPTCSQNASDRYFEPNTENMAEDCLFLNLWVPYSRKTTHLKPIIIFIHGGAFNLGSGNMPIYDGTNLAKFGDVIVANMNYRVGVLGFFLAFIEEADGNMGIYDQILAMKWIKRNSKSFGGDPDHIVLMGESAGSMMTGGHLVSPLTKNLFKRVIMHSGAPTLPLMFDNNERLYNISQKFATMVGCADKRVTLKDDPNIIVQCMKRLPVEVLTKAEGRLKLANPVTFYPRTGDAYLPKPVIYLLQEGNFKDTEMLIGVNEMEGTFFLSVVASDYFGLYGRDKPDTISKTLAFQLIRYIFKFTDQKNVKEIAVHYTHSIQSGTLDVYTEGISRSLGDYLINCGAYFHAEYHAMRNPVYYYMLSKKLSTTVNAEWMKTTHFDELQYIFGNPMFGNFTDEEVVFSERMMARWISFAKTGNPNVAGLIRWPKFTRQDPEYLEMNDEEVVRLRPDDHRCEFWRDRFQAEFDPQIINKIKRSINSGVSFATSILTVIMCVFFSVHIN